MNWTQPICMRCYEVREPGRQPFRIKAEFAEEETCCDCGEPTQAGIYYRIDPRTVKYPTPEDDDPSGQRLELEKP
jgi:hypothetical protein